MEKLVNIFNEVRSCYFPRWDSKNRWTIEAGTKKPGTSEAGWCDTENKRILVSPHRWVANDDSLYVLIIHEICHAVASPSHGKKFQARLLEVAHKAQNRGGLALAEALRAEAKYYAEAPVGTSHDIYCEIADAVQDAPDLSKDAVFAWVANNYRFTIQELLERYPRAEAVYNQKQAELKKMHARQQGLRNRLGLG